MVPMLLALHGGKAEQTSQQQRGGTEAEVRADDASVTYFSPATFTSNQVDNPNQSLQCLNLEWTPCYSRCCYCYTDKNRRHFGRTWNTDFMVAQYCVSQYYGFVENTLTGWISMHRCLDINFALLTNCLQLAQHKNAQLHTYLCMVQVIQARTASFHYACKFSYLNNFFGKCLGKASPFESSQKQLHRREVLHHTVLIQVLLDASVNVCLL